ncbi:hypothetical protein TIFTF001_026246 [Ficus carica]|uniref:Reverse transcriptase zinc-binding domain-containing protein n=1 Tax=Ficus carica TaxID=3494 RepID=A0AA88DKV5_FICCA|nr:hypothetical protein TIFTF001_026246 [Ficus carica]
MTDNSLACDFMRKRYVSNARQPKVGPAMSSIWAASEIIMLCSRKIAFGLQENNQSSTSGKIIGLGSTDVVRWRHCSGGSPKTSDFYDHVRPRRATVNWGEKIWRSSIQPRRSMIAWKQAIHGCLATEKFLHKMGFYLPSCCHFCFAVEEDGDHLFVSCDFARTIWAKLESTFHARLDKTGIQQLILSALNCKMSK